MRQYESLENVDENGDLLENFVLTATEVVEHTVKFNLSCVAHAWLLGTTALLHCKCRSVPVQSLCPNDQGQACRWSRQLPQMQKMMRLTGRKVVRPAAAVATIQGLSRQRASHLHPPTGGLSAPTAKQIYPLLTKGKHGLREGSRSFSPGLSCQPQEEEWFRGESISGRGSK